MPFAALQITCKLSGMFDNDILGPYVESEPFFAGVEVC